MIMMMITMMIIEIVVIVMVMRIMKIMLKTVMGIKVALVILSNTTNSNENSPLFGEKMLFLAAGDQ